MTRMITAMFDSRTTADAAAEQLMRELSLTRAAVQVHGGAGELGDTTSAGSSSASTYAGSSAADESDRGFWGSLRDLFVPDEDRTTYAEGLRRGSFLVSAEVDEDRIDQAMDVLEAHGAVDLESREAQWRESGWSSDATTSLPTSPEIGVAGTTNEPITARPGGAGGDFSNHPAPGSMTSEQGRQVGAGMSTPAARTSTTGMSTGGMSATDKSAMGTSAKGMSTKGRDTEEVIPMVEERMQIGKRDVERGRVRVRSYIVETPVNEQVTLRSENVEVQRRTVDRAARPGDDLFRERTIEAVERGEEAVVAKETRVTGEVVLRKEATERTETVHDKIRRTEVDVQDDTTQSTPHAKGSATGSATGTGTGTGKAMGTSSAPDGTPGNPPGTMASRAVDNTLGTNLSDKDKTRKP